MMVVIKRAETKLLREIKRYSKECPRQKCFYIQFSTTSLDKRQVFETFLRQLNALPNAYMAQVYICRDQDIFILMQGFMQRHFSALITSLSESLNAPEIKNIASIFEIGRHKKVLENLCHDKLAKIQKQDSAIQEQTQQKIQDRITTRILSTLEPHTIESLSLRRKKRTAPLVMIADDDQLSRTLAGNVINKDYSVAYAADGEEALQGYVRHAPDVMFLDIGMPDISGHQVLESVFQVDPDAYIIMFSGRKDKENIMRALETGAQGFVGKPFTRDKLYEYIGKSPFVREKNDSHNIPVTERLTHKESQNR